MDFEQASDIVRQLADGLDPSTGEPLSPGDACQRPQVLRALYAARRALEQAQRPAGLRSQRPRPENAGRPWSDEEDGRLADAHDSGTSPEELARRHGRSAAGIRARLVKLGKLPPAESRYVVRGVAAG